LILTLPPVIIWLAAGVSTSKPPLEGYPIMTTVYKELLRMGPDEESLFYTMASDPESFPAWEITEAGIEMQDDDEDGNPAGTGISYNRATLMAQAEMVLHSNDGEQTYALVWYANEDVGLYLQQEGTAS